MRGGSDNNIYVVPTPTVLSFGTATLLSAACCIPSILSLIFMWDKILKYNLKRPSPRREDENIDDDTIKRLDKVMKGFLRVVEAPFFVFAVLAILIWGEINLFSDQVNYETEPMACVGRCRPDVPSLAHMANASRRSRQASGHLLLEPGLPLRGLCTFGSQESPRSKLIRSPILRTIIVRGSQRSSEATDSPADALTPPRHLRPGDRGYFVRLWPGSSSGKASGGRQAHSTHPMVAIPLAWSNPMGDLMPLLGTKKAPSTSTHLQPTFKSRE